MLQKNPYFFFGSPFIYFGSNQIDDDLDFFPFSLQKDLILSNQERIGLFIHWIEEDEMEDIQF